MTSNMTSYDSYGWITPSKIEVGTQSQRTPDPVSCWVELLDTQGFFGVREKWVLLEISWTLSCFTSTENPQTKLTGTFGERIPLFLEVLFLFEGHSRKGSTKLKCPGLTPTPLEKNIHSTEFPPKKRCPSAEPILSSFLFSSSSSPPKA